MNHTWRAKERLIICCLLILFAATCCVRKPRCEHDAGADCSWRARYMIECYSGGQSILREPGDNPHIVDGHALSWDTPHGTNRSTADCKATAFY